MIWAAAAAALSLLFFSLGGRGRTAADRDRGAPGIRHGAVNDEAEPCPGRASRFLEFPARLLPPHARERLFGGLDAGREIPGISLDRMVGIGVWASLLLPLGTLALTGLSPAGLVAAPVLALSGLLLPRLLVSRAGAHHMETVKRALPDTADILYSLVLGGKNLDQAFKNAAALAPEPLSGYLMSAVREIELGSTREEAFDRLADRCPLRELKSLLRSLLEAERRGYSLSSSLSVFSREIRLRRRDALREAGARAPLKMLAPLVFLILPASVLLTVGPTFLATLQQVF